MGAKNVEKSVVIVGVGIAGLSTGCYARMNGYKTTIFEMHNIPGGLCTAWKRKGYTFDISMHFLIAREEHRWLHFLHHCFDPSMAPPGSPAAEVWYATPYEYWEELARDRVRYEEEKERIADYNIAELDKRWPGFASRIEVVEVATPATYVRYTGNWRGSPDGWYATTENVMKRTPLRSLPGLSGFHMVGQWTMGRQAAYPPRRWAFL